MKIVKAVITKQEIISMCGPIPFAVQVRILLNKQGIRFVDDGKFSMIINENPEPLGKLIQWEEFASGGMHFKQELPEWE